MNQTIKGEAKDLYLKIKDYDLSKIVERHRKDDDVGLEIAEERALELKKWLVLARTNSENNYQLTGNIDKIWHTFLQFTKDYHAFCEELGGFVHHEPADIVKIREAKNNPELLNQLNEEFNRDYRALISDYIEVFESKPPTSIWPDITNPLGRDTPDGGGGCSSSCSCGCGGSQNPRD